MKKVKVADLRQFSLTDLESRVKDWREELFRSRFKQQTNEAPDTSIGPKLKRNIAQALTLIGEKRRQESTAALKTGLD